MRHLLRSTFGAALVLASACAAPVVSVVADAEPPGTSYARALDRWTRLGRALDRAELDTMLLVSATMRSKAFQRAFAERYVSVYRVESPEERAKVMDTELRFAEEGLSFFVQTSSHFTVWNDLTQPPTISPPTPPKGFETAPAAVIASPAVPVPVPIPPVKPEAPSTRPIAPLPTTPTGSPNAVEASPKVKWRITLVDDQGHETTPVEVTSVGNTSRQALEVQLMGQLRDPYARAWNVRFPTTRADGQPLFSPSTQRLILRFAGPVGQTDLTWNLNGR